LMLPTEMERDPPPWLWVRVEQQRRSIQNVELIAVSTDLV
jgi:hypothetical protein